MGWHRDLWRTRIPFSARFLSPPCSNPHPRLCDSVIPPFSLRSCDLSTYLILSGAPSSAGEARGGGDRQEARAWGSGSDPRSALRGRPEPQAGPATAYRLQPRAPAQAAVAGTGRAWTLRGGGAEASSPAGPPRSSASPPCPLPAPPASDWLSGPQPAQHWPARLSLDLAPPPAGAGHRVSVLGDHPSTRGLRRSRVENRGWPSPSCTRTPAELHLRGDRFILPKCRRKLQESTGLGVFGLALNSSSPLYCFVT